MLPGVWAPLLPHGQIHKGCRAVVLQDRTDLVHDAHDLQPLDLLIGTVPGGCRCHRPADGMAAGPQVPGKALADNGHFRCAIRVALVEVPSRHQCHAHRPKVAWRYGGDLGTRTFGLAGEERLVRHGHIVAASLPGP